MKRIKYFLILSSVFFLACCAGNKESTSSQSGQSSQTSTSSFTPTDPGDGYIDTLPLSHDQGALLQAFCWKYSDVSKNLEAIKDAGFKVIQISPVQDPKGGGLTWWSYYQPLSFKIAEESGLGTKEELSELCDKAEEMGISIIADVIFNHMANIQDGEYEADGTPKVSPEVAKFEPEIYANRNSASNPTFHHVKNPVGSGKVTQRYEYGDLPDVNTANKFVQSRVLQLLKDCIDIGIDGFRIDTAKHIETPDDPNYASDFWPNTLGKANVYYKDKYGTDLFSYGEILNDPDGGRDISIYTKLMKVTENSYAASLTSASSKKDATVLLNASYGKSTDPSNLIAWVESHDTYVDAESHFSDLKTARMYAALASRKDITPMYLARPDDMVSVGKVANYYFENEAVATANRFHNRFIGAEEKLSANGSVFVNERYFDDDKGALIINFAGESQNVEVNFNKLSDGVYFDSVTGNAYEIKNGKANIDFDRFGVVVLTRTKDNAHPRLSVTPRETNFMDSLDIEVDASHFLNATYKINDQEERSLVDVDKISLTKADVDENDNVTITFNLTNQRFSLKREIHYHKFTLIEGHFNVFNFDMSNFDNYSLYYWAWGGSKGSSWHKLDNYTVQQGVLLLDFTGDDTQFLLAKFPKGYTIKNMKEWDNNCIKQSSDIKISDKYFDAKGF